MSKESTTVKYNHIEISTKMHLGITHAARVVYQVKKDHSSGTLFHCTRAFYEQNLFNTKAIEALTNHDESEILNYEQGPLCFFNNQPVFVTATEHEQFDLELCLIAPDTRYGRESYFWHITDPARD